MKSGYVSGHELGVVLCDTSGFIMRLKMPVIDMDRGRLPMTRVGTPPLEKTTSASKARFPPFLVKVALPLIENWVCLWPLSEISSSETLNITLRGLLILVGRAPDDALAVNVVISFYMIKDIDRVGRFCSLSASWSNLTVPETVITLNEAC